MVKRKGERGRRVARLSDPRFDRDGSSPNGMTLPRDAVSVGIAIGRAVTPASSGNLDGDRWMPAFAGVTA